MSQLERPLASSAPASGQLTRHSIPNHLVALMLPLLSVPIEEAVPRLAALTIRFILRLEALAQLANLKWEALRSEYCVEQIA